jgi:molybdate transport system regulatory protein
VNRSSFEYLAAPLWLLFAGRELLMGKAMELLRQIDSKGSLTKAAQAIPMSYKSAWDLIDRINNISSQPVVVTATGGRHGGGTMLSEYGKSLLLLYSSLERSYESTYSIQNDKKPELDVFLKIIKRMCFKTSARNQLAGIVKRIKKGIVNSDIVIDVGQGTEVVAVITNDSVRELELVKESEVVLLVKASAVTLFANSSSLVKFDTNVFEGTVVDVRRGELNCEVILSLQGGKSVTSVISKDTAEALAVKEGVKLVAAFKPSQVIIAMPM